MFQGDKIWMGVGDVPVNLLLNQANRHGLIAGASGTGKTVTLKVMAEGFSKAGVPVFMADVKGDVTGMAQTGEDSDNIKKRVEKFGLEGFTLEGCPCRFWDMLGGQGYVNILNAAKLIQSPQIYAMFLLWMLSELFDTLPEAGDLDKPKFVFFFDEAHLLFNNMPGEFLDKIIQVVKLIRSKGVGVYFITQSPSDIPDEVLAQLSNRIQHGLRAYTPAEQKAVRAAASSFRANPKFKSEDVILELGTGEALVSFLNEEGQPCVVENAKILPPQCLMAAASQECMDKALADQASLMEKCGTAIDRESAFEIISGEAQKAAEEEKLAEERAALEAEKAELEKQKAKEEAKAAKEAEKAAAKAEREAEKEAERAAKAAEKQKQELFKDVTKAATSILGHIGRDASKQIMRGLFGTRKR